MCLEINKKNLKSIIYLEHTFSINSWYTWTAQTKTEQFLEKDYFL